MMIDSEIEFELDTTEIADEVRRTLVSEVEDIVEITIQNFDFDDQVETAVSRLDLNEYLDHNSIRYNIEDDITDYVVTNIDIDDRVSDALLDIDLSEYVDTDDIAWAVKRELHDYEMLYENQVDILERLGNLQNLVRELEIEIMRLKTPLLVRIVNKIRGWF
tara:strand:+ start:6577 stop:7062 length:486 start_codon:yes stop_codon:yes gene_type:complete